MNKINLLQVRLSKWSRRCEGGTNLECISRNESFLLFLFSHIRLTKTRDLSLPYIFLCTFVFNVLFIYLFCSLLLLVMMVSSAGEALHTGFMSCSQVQIHRSPFPRRVMKLETRSNLTDSTSAVIRQPAPGAAHFRTCCSPTWAQLKLTPDHRCQDQFLENTWLQNWPLWSSTYQKLQTSSVRLNLIRRTTEETVAGDNSMR